MAASYWPSMESTSLRFAEAARHLGAALRRHGLAVPAFRSPPRARGRVRTLRRNRDGSATVSVVVRDRPWTAVLADMVDGAVVANRLEGVAAEQVRDALWSALDGLGSAARGPRIAPMVGGVDAAA